MKIIFADEFSRQFGKLPADIQRLYRTQEARFREDWRDSRLHIKKLREQPYPFSFRITRNYRVLFAFVEPETVLFATIGNRRDVYKTRKRGR